MLATRIGIVLSLGWLAVACGGDDPAAGTERGPCRADGTCDAELVCLSDLCVRPAGGPDAGGPDGGDVDGGDLDAGDLDGGGVDAGDVDAGIADGGIADGAPDAAGAERRTYVMASITVPQSAAEAGTSSLDLDGDGTLDNQIAQAFASFASTGIDARGDLDEGVAVGEVLLLVEARAPSFAADGSAQGRVLRGESPSPAPCPTPEDTICGAHLAGTGSFDVVAPAPALVAGTITAGTLALGPGEAWLPLALFGEVTLVPITGARLQARLAAGGLEDGILAGSIIASEIDGTVYPALHAGAAAAVARDCPGGACDPGSDGATALAIFDADGDGAITLEEVRSHPLVGGLLAPDLDLDGDGTNDALSTGARFTAVGATFAAP